MSLLVKASLLLVDCGRVSKTTRGFNGPFAEPASAPFFQRTQA
jgi:hypothetical protein